MLSPSSWYDSPLPKSIRYQKMNRSAAFLKLLFVGPTCRPIHKKFWSQLFLTERHSNVCPKTGFPQIPWFIMVYHHFPIKIAMVHVSAHFSTWACDNLKTKSPSHDEFRQRSCGTRRENPIEDFGVLRASFNNISWLSGSNLPEKMWVSSSKLNWG